MTPQELVEHLKGKTIVDIKWHSYLGWDMCIGEIILNDGTVIEPSGNSDECIVAMVTINGEDVRIEKTE